MDFAVASEDRSARGEDEGGVVEFAVWCKFGDGAGNEVDLRIFGGLGEERGGGGGAGVERGDGGGDGLGVGREVLRTVGGVETLGEDNELGGGGGGEDGGARGSEVGGFGGGGGELEERELEGFEKWDGDGGGHFGEVARGEEGVECVRTRVEAGLVEEALEETHERLMG